MSGSRSDAAFDSVNRVPAAISVVVVNYNGEAVLAPLLDSLRASLVRPAETIVVDNASTDGSIALLRSRPDVVTVPAGGNLGFGPACNLGAAHATSALLLFCNADVEFTPEALGVLAARAQATPDAGVVAPTLLEPAYPAHDREDRVEDVAAMAFAAALVTREAFDAVGGFDPRLFVYWDETDLCYRVVLSGRRVLKDWNAVVEHELHGSGGGSRLADMQVANGLYVHLKLRAWPACARFALRMIAKTLLISVRRRDLSALRAWSANGRALRSTLAERRRVRGAAAPQDRARLDALGSTHDAWQRRAWWSANVRNRVYVSR